MDEVKLTGLKDVVAWLECQPQWSGVAVRRVDDPPIPGEPFISMESAKHLIVSAVSIMDNRSLEAAARILALEEALKPFSETAKLYNHPYSQPDAPDNVVIIQWANIVEKITVSDLRRAARAYANKGEPT